MKNNRAARWLNSWWLWNDPDSGSSDLVRRWRKVVFAIALLMPLFGCLGTVVLVGLDRLSLYTVRTKDSFINALLILPVLWLWGSFVNWPFFVFGRVVTRRLRAKWPVVRDTQWAGIGGLIGLSLPYAFGYVEMPFELTSGAQDAGQGVGLYLPLIAPIFGFILGSAGWLFGIWAAKLSIFFKRDAI